MKVYESIEIPRGNNVIQKYNLFVNGKPVLRGTTDKILNWVCMFIKPQDKYVEISTNKNGWERRSFDGKRTRQIRQNVIDFDNGVYVSE